MANDTVNVQRGIVGAGADDDTYVLSASLVDDNAQITISDVEGSNTIQLIGGLTISSSIVAGDTAQLTLSNGAVVTILGASTMSYVVGGNPLTGVEGVTKDYTAFATDILGTTVPAEGEANSTGGESTVNEDGTATGGDPNAPTYSLAAGAESVDEGATATFTLTTTNVTEGTEVAYTLSGVDAADVTGGSLTGTATVAADGTATISVALVNDGATEGAETLTVTLDGMTTSASTTVNDTSVPASYTVTSDVTSVTEGETVTFTVTATSAADVDTTLNYQLMGVEVAGGTADPATDLGNVTGEVVIPAGATSATFTVIPTDDGTTEGFEGFKVSLLDGSFNTVATSDNVVIKDGAEAGQTFNLTTSTDNVQGTDGNDTVNGVIQAAGATGTTIAPGDSIAGGAGEDVLNISIAGESGTGGFTLSAVTTTDVEKVLVSNFDTDGDDTRDNTIDASLMTGLTTVGTSASAALGDTVFSNLKNVVSAELRNGAGDLQLDYTSSVVSGTDDTQALTVSNNTAGTFIANSIENLSVTSESVKSSLKDLQSDALKKVTILGDQDLTVTDSIDFAATTNGTTVDGTLDASAFTGKLSVKLDGAQTVQVTTGSGDDTIDMATNLTTNDIIDAGEGTDTVAITAHDGDTTYLKVSDYKLTNVEVFQVEATTNKDTKLDLDGSSVSKVILVENDTDAKAANVKNLSANSTVQLNNNVSGGTHAIGNVDLSLKDASGTSDVLNVVLAGTSGHGSTDGNDVDQLTVSNTETLNVESTHLGSTAFTTSDANVLTSLVADSSLATLNITGSDAVQLSVSSAATGLANIDGSTATGKTTVTVSATANNTIKTGSADDTVNFGTTLTKDDVVDTGAGTKDTVTATVGTLSAANGKFNITNAETLALTHTSGTTTNLDLSGTTGLTTLSLVSSADNGTGTVNVTNIDGQTVVFANGNGFDGTADLSLKDETGAADTVTVNFKDETDGVNGYDVTLKVDATVETTALTLEKFKSDGTTANTGDIDANVDGVKSATITVSGGNTGTDLDLTEGSKTLSTTTTTLNTSSFIGTLTANASANIATTFILNGTSIQDVDGSSQGDTVTVSSTSATHVLDGGAGTDTLNLTLANGTTNATTINNFETINLTVDNSAAAVVTAAANNFFNDADAKTLVITGGNSISSFDSGTDGIDSTSGLTTVDASGFEGKLTNILFDADELASTVTVTGAKSTSDTVSASYTGNQTVKMSAVETFAVTLTADTTLDMSGVTGLTKLTFTDTVGGGSDDLVLQDLMNDVALEVTGTADGTTLTVDLADKTTNTANAQSVKLVAVASADDDIVLAGTDIETWNIESAATAGADLNLSGISMTESGKTTSVVFTGSQALEVTALNADVATFDASAMTAAITMSGRSGTSAMTQTGTSSADTLIMAHKDDAINAGDGADTLTINYTSVIGGMAIDLSSTSDQITTFNGSSNSAVQVGFQHVNLTGYTGNGAEVTANASGSNITGTTAVDQITLGAGADNVIYTGGNDTIQNFTAGTDDLNFDSLTGINGNGVDQATGATKVADATDGEIYVFASSADPGPDGESIASFTDKTDVAAYLESALTSASAENYVAVINDSGNAGNAYVYLIDVDADDGTTNRIDAGDITLLGVVDGGTTTAISAADID